MNKISATLVFLTLVLLNFTKLQFSSNKSVKQICSLNLAEASSVLLFWWLGVVFLSPCSAEPIDSVSTTQTGLLIMPWIHPVILLQTTDFTCLPFEAEIGPDDVMVMSSGG